ncbi:FMN-dependent NADH-azoreductase [Rhodovulum sp. YNF3179]|uniref:FMN-dependent NADH-azoreductase n=1 Tax=Rhodovulum sp. YNF3179 TaxID=3425127 RepID=UPI003D33D740
MTEQPSQILRIDTSIRGARSVTRALTGRILDRLTAAAPAARVVSRDLSGGLPFVDAAWTDAAFTPETDRTPDQAQALALSDELIAELQAADTLVIGLPVYNFTVPTQMNAWIDQVARAGVTFRYTENGPEGLMTGKRAIVAMASDGTAEGSDVDFASGYLRHMLGFFGITDVSFVIADALMRGRDEKMQAAEARVDALPLAA